MPRYRDYVSEFLCQLAYGEDSIGRIHCKTGMRYDSLYGIAKLLVEMGLIAREKASGRSGFSYYLTPEGRDLLARKNVKL